MRSPFVTLRALAPWIACLVMLPGCTADGEELGVSTAEVSKAREALDRPVDRALVAAFLIVDGVYNTELTAPFDVFEHTRHHAPPGIEVFTVSPDGGEVVTAEGLRLVADHSFESAPVPDILVVPSAENSRDSDLENRRLIDWVRDTGDSARFVMSLCWGAFVLAEAGLLDDRSCTTFPSDYERFARRFPTATLHVNASYVHDDRMITSQGGVRSYDAAMYLVDLIFGTETATAVGRGLLIAWPPPHDSLAVSDPVYQRQAGY